MPTVAQALDNQVQYAFDGTLLVEVYDLMFHTGDDVKPASSQADQGTELLNQQLFAQNFAGVSAEGRVLANTAAVTNFPVWQSFRGDFLCASATWEVGDLVAVDEASSGTALEDQKLVKTTDRASAIGECTRREANATTTVRVQLRSNVTNTNLRTGDSSVIWVSTTGSDDGDGSFSNPYLTIAAAFAVVTATRKTVMLMPGRYTSAASILWPNDVTDVLITGMTADYESTEIHASAGDEVIEILPGATIGAENVLCFFANLTISADDGVNGVQVTDTNITAGKKLIVTFRDCGFSNDTDTDKSLVTTHTIACKIKIYMHGRGFGGNNIEGLVFIDCFDNGDRFKANGMNFEGGVEFSVDAVTCENEFFACVMKLNGGAGGNDVQSLRANGCMSRDGMTQAAAALGDFAANAEEAFLSLT